MKKRCVLVVLGLLAALFWGAPPAHFDAQAQTAAARTIALNHRPPSPVSLVNSITLTNQSGSAIRNYPFQFGRPFVAGAIADQPNVLINGRAAASQADVKNRYPDGSVEFAVMAVVVPGIPANGSVQLTFQDTTTNSNAPLSAAQMLDPSYNFDLAATLTPNSGTVQTADARTMLTNGDYTLWTSGPVAQTIMLADDTTARKYDIGFGPGGGSGGFHPLRPRFYATFWPATRQVFVRAVVESANPQEVEDTAYKVAITAGASSPATVYTADLSGTQAANPKIHWAMSSWDRSSWLGGVPPAQVNIDNNLAYLESTRFLPNYDASVGLTAAALAGEYAAWTGRPHDIYDGVWDGGMLQNAMGTTGARQDIGPYPTWTAMWLMTGDWRMRQVALGLADLAPAWPYHLRESDPTKIFMRGGAAGVGLGLPFSIAGRPTLRPAVPSWGDTVAADALKFVGPVSSANPWQFLGSHEPAPFYPQYILTGDPFYLNENEFWANWTVALAIPVGEFAERGPAGSYGGIYDEVRGAAWELRDRAEAAFAEPDGSLEKSYLTPLVNDALARWEGQFGITGTPYTGSVMQVWGAAQAVNTYLTPTPVHGWENNVFPAGIAQDEAVGIFAPGAASSYGDPWQQWYLLYCLGRTAELGFAAGPVAQWTGKYMTDLIDNSGIPQAIAIYQMPVASSGGSLFPDWAHVFAALAPAYVTGVGWNSALGGTLAQNFAANVYPQGYAAYAMAALAPLVDEGATGAGQAWTWMARYVRQPLMTATGWDADPSWAIVPRTDTNTLPAQPTVQ